MEQNSVLKDGREAPHKECLRVIWVRLFTGT